MEKKKELMIEVLKEHYEKLKKLPKPESRKIGGTYYGSTQIFSSVGNHLDLEENTSHISYGYAGCNTQYVNATILRVGGAYKEFSRKEIEDKLKEIMGGKFYDSETKTGIISDYGTNFSVIGFGTIVH